MLFYQSYFPSPRFRSLIARYMIISDDETHREWQQLKVTPLGLSGLGFSFGADFRYHTSAEKERTIFDGQLCGIHDCNYMISWKKPFNFLVIAFKPAGLYPILQTDMSCLRNNLYNLSSLGVKESEWICETLSKLPLHMQKIIFIESWLERRLAKTSFAFGITGEIAQKIIEKKGKVLIKDLSREFNVNKKYLERHFHRELGSGPKEFASLVRFNYLNTLLQEQPVSWKELVYLGNFHDQSHLIKHFNRITGLTPKEFVKTADRRPLTQFVNKHNVHELVSTNVAIPGGLAQ